MRPALLLLLLLVVLVGGYELYSRIHVAPAPDLAAAEIAPPALLSPETVVVPRVDSAPGSTGADWAPQGLAVNVLQNISDQPTSAPLVPASARLAWTHDAFLVHVEVEATQTVEADKDDQLYEGDRTELFFFCGPHLEKAAQVVVAPGLDPKHPTKRVQVVQKPSADFAVTTQVQKTQTGYAVDVGFPWKDFGIEPANEQACAVQVIVHQQSASGPQLLGWFPTEGTYSDRHKSIGFTLGETASPPVNLLAKLTPLLPGLVRVTCSAAPAARDREAIVSQPGVIVSRIGGLSAVPTTIYLPISAHLDPAAPLQVSAQNRLLAQFSHADQENEIESIGDDLGYHFNRCVFSDPSFPPAEFDQDQLVHAWLGPVTVETKFYNAKFEEVTQADQPGRYGAVSTIHLPGDVVVRRYQTLYRTPKDIVWWHTPFPVHAQLPAELGFSPALLARQDDSIGEAVKDGFIDDMERSDEAAALFAALDATPAQAPKWLTRTGPWTQDAIWWEALRAKLNLSTSYNYLIDLPADLKADPQKRWPLILFLHGSGERGRDVQLVRKNGLAALMGAGKQLPAIVVSPICPLHEHWNPFALQRLLAAISAQYPVDPDRIVVTGLSMGGFGTWELGQDFPDRFAALAPVCGEGDPDDAARLKATPVWAFHGGKDRTVPPEESIKMVAAIRKIGGHPHLTIFPDAGHDSWTQAYATDALYTWMLAQKRGQPEVPVAGVP